ncbi:MAG: hypothetical protein KKD25_06020 [Gammaproteobacteria bacterium]|jgi:hypothetical protein|nr:hypothetical protein [Gammaproteobacteria bacterium]MBU0773337.1 hypothetical protein [Gammaproteobacteria bacterium]MBU0854729.1 hypothetical protein [Gammaproteobacteria bacterium]MBU1846695.1 hypothetical protein [Gammaproteobacteria bacterium]
MRNVLRRCAFALFPFCMSPHVAQAGDAAQDDARAAYELERKRADLDYSRIRAECERLPGEAKEHCLARAKTAHEADVAAARSKLEAATGRAGAPAPERP